MRRRKRTRDGTHQGTELRDTLHDTPQDGADDEVGAAGARDVSRRSRRVRAAVEQDAQEETCRARLGVGRASTDEETCTA